MADAPAALQRGRQKSPRVLGMVEINYCCLNIFLLLYVTGQELNSGNCFTVPYHLHLPGKRQSCKNCCGPQERKERKKKSPPSCCFPSLVKRSKWKKY